MFDFNFVRNLAATVIAVTLLSLVLAEVHAQPERVAKQKRVLVLEQAVKMGIVIKGRELR